MALTQLSLNKKKTEKKKQLFQNEKHILTQLLLPCLLIEEHILSFLNFKEEIKKNINL